MLITKLCLTHLRYAEARLPSLKKNLQINGIDSQTLEREANIGVMIRNFTEFTAGYLGPWYYGAKTLSMQAKKLAMSTRRVQIEIPTHWATSISSSILEPSRPGGALPTPVILWKNFSPLYSFGMSTLCDLPKSINLKRRSSDDRAMGQSNKDPFLTRTFLGKTDWCSHPAEWRR